MPSTPDISVVIPVRDEKDSVAELTRRLLENLTGTYEIIFIDDGSTDGTWEQLCQLHESGRIKLVKFRASCGKSVALSEGFARTRAPIVFTLDGDLQDDPAEFPAFLEKLESGYDLVTGWNKTRHDPFHKVVASRMFNFLLRQFTGIQLQDMNCGFKCYRGELARSLKLQGDQHRFIPVYAVHLGYRVGEIEVKHHPRLHGQSKYGFSRLIKGFFDLGTVLLQTRFKGRPAHGFGFAACASFLAAVLLLIGMVSSGPTLETAILSFWISLVLGIGAVILAAAGWIAEVQSAPGTAKDSTPFPNIEDVRD